MDAAVRVQLLEVVGTRGVTAEGAVLPASSDELAAAVRVLAATGTSFSVSSGAAPASAAGAAVSLSRLTTVEVAPASLTLRAGAGATITAIRDAAAGEHLGVVGFPASPSAGHAGSLVVRGEVPRRSLCGVEAVLTTGDVVRFGGGVLKDVVGYDLPALLLGSMGRLAVITLVTFRLEPEMARTPCPAPPGPSRDGLALVAAAFDPQGLLRTP